MGRNGTILCERAQDANHDTGVTKDNDSPDRILLDSGVTSNADEQLHSSLHHCPPAVAGIRKSQMPQL